MQSVIYISCTQLEMSRIFTVYQCYQCLKVKLLMYGLKQMRLILRLNNKYQIFVFFTVLSLILTSVVRVVFSLYRSNSTSILVGFDFLKQSFFENQQRIANWNPQIIWIRHMAFGYKFAQLISWLLLFAYGPLLNPLLCHSRSTFSVFISFEFFSRKNLISNNLNLVCSASERQNLYIQRIKYSNFKWK